MVSDNDLESVLKDMARLHSEAKKIEETAKSTFKDLSSVMASNNMVLNQVQQIQTELQNLTTKWDTISQELTDCHSRFSQWKSSNKNVAIEAQAKAVKTEEEYQECMKVLSDNSDVILTIHNETIICKEKILKQEEELFKKEKEEMLAREKSFDNEHKTSQIAKQYMEIRKKKLMNCEKTQ